jgi:Tol biopolymer transport system component/DNA-binding CsgD family transcriptional regulator
MRFTRVVTTVPDGARIGAQGGKREILLRIDDLSPKQRQVLDGVAAGKSNGVIAGEIGITLDGVKWHVSELLGEGGFADRHELGAWWREQTSRQPAPALLAASPAHRSLGAVARIAAVFVVAAAIAFGIAAAAHRSAGVIVAPTAAAADRLAYVQDGDLWVKTLPDGPPVRMTTSGKASSPRWSHSGKWLAYGDGSSEWITRVDGSDARAADDFVAWSPVDDRYAGLSAPGADGYWTIFTENADGTNRVSVYKTFSSNGHLSTQLRAPVWSPDGRWLAFVIYQQEVTGTPPERSVSIWVSGASGNSPPTKVYDGGSPSQADTVLFAWSPDDSRIFFWSDPQFSASAFADGLPLIGVRRDGSDAHGFGYSDDALLTAPEFQSWNAGGALAVTGGGGRETWMHKDIRVVDTATGGYHVLTGPVGAESAVAALEPAWSPDGASIAYVAAPDAPGVSGGDAAKAALARRKIWAMDADGANQRQLTDDPAYRDERPLWSGDGSRIYFVRLDANDNASLWWVPANGGAPTEVVDDVSPVPDAGGAPAWFGYYGYIAWDDAFALWTAPSAR